MNLFIRSFLATSIFFIFFSIGALFYLFETEWVDFTSLENYTTGKSSIVLDDEGKEFARFELDKRAPISFEKLPPILVDAFIAAEDHDFFNHYGISFRGIIRSAWVNLCHRRVVQGASTITQQLAKLMFLSNDRTLLRKIQDIFLALQLERQFTKEKIFELYVNNIYLGRGIYGVEAACRRFWNKSVLDISLDQAAVLASAAKSARLYSPLNSLEMAKRRRNLVLKSMLNLNFITSQDYQDAASKDVEINEYLSENPVRLYLKEWIRNWAENKWGKDILYASGLKIKTTINLQMQNLSENIFSQNIEKLRLTLGQELNGGMLAMEPCSGKIKAAVGGVDFRLSQYNRSFQAVRQMGSAFKPIIYTAALKSGMKMNDVYVDEPFEMEMPTGEVWRPKNWTNRFDGPMTLLKALSFSNNIVTIKVFRQLGAYCVMDWAKKFEITRNLMSYPSSALGTAEGTVEECAAAFNVFANNGEYMKPYLIEWVKDKWGKKLWEYEEVRHKVVDSKTNSKMVNALSYRMKRAENLYGPKNWINAESIGKSGSTNGASSTWFVGSTPQLTTAVYLGRDDNKQMGKNVFASKTALPIWLEFNKGIDFKNKHFYIDPELKEKAIDWDTGMVLKNVNKKNSIVILEDE